MQGQPKQSSIPKIMHIRPQVMKNGRRRGADRLAKTLMSPLFSATKTRPSGEKRTAVGCVSPESTVDSENPAGNVAAWIGLVIEPRRQVIAVQVPAQMRIKFSNFRILPHSENVK